MGSQQESTWAAFAKEKLGPSGMKQIAESLETLDHHLKMRTFFSGYQISEDDKVLFEALKGTKFIYLFITCIRLTR